MPVGLVENNLQVVHPGSELIRSAWILECESLAGQHQFGILIREIDVYRIDLRRSTLGQRGRALWKPGRESADLEGINLDLQVGCYGQADWRNLQNGENMLTDC